MFRAAAWTGGLFAVGGGICHYFSGPLVEPMVLLALGSTLFYVSGRIPPSASEATQAADASGTSPVRAVQ